MSVRNKDPKGHWRCKTVAFCVFPEEVKRLDLQVKTAGLQNQDFLVQKALNDKVVVHPNIRVQKYILEHLAALTEQMKEMESLSDSSNSLEKIRCILDMKELWEQGKVKSDGQKRASEYFRKLFLLFNSISK